MTEPRIRFNWGYWDGRYDQERGKSAPWCKPWQTKGHPFDKVYGHGYWIGRYDNSGTDSSDDAWRSRPNMRRH